MKRRDTEQTHRTRRGLLTRAGALGGLAGLGSLGGVALAGCGQQGAPAPQTIPPATIEYAYNSGSGALATARSELVDKFMAAVPAIKVNQLPGQPETMVLEKFKAAAAAGTPPDVVSLNTNVTGDLVASKMIAPLDDLIKSRGQGFSRDAFYPEVLNAQTVDGRLYGVPRFVQTMLLYFNRDLFARAGLAEPNENWTWEKDFQDTATRLKAFMAGAVAEPTFQVTFGADLRNSLVTSWGGDFFDKTGKKATLEEAKALAGLEFAHGLRYRQRFAAEQGQEAGATFNNGRIAMNVAGSFAYGGLLSGPFKPGVTLFPRGPGGRRQTGNATGYSITEGSKNKPAAWEFVKWLVGDNGQQHLALTETTTPATKKVYPPKDTPSEVTRIFFEALKTGLYFPPLKGFSEIYTQINTELNVSLNDNARSVRDSARAASDAANRLLAQ
ncbi:MAG TPA: sugar ABC transporter substrate-binding protein [Chloroflexota bacterium]|nr:sugar ABC transporter substrate-binding protein [Chloroflexota bacterium]